MLVFKVDNSRGLMEEGGGLTSVERRCHGGSGVAV
jgi:hypothetical protein